MEEINKQDGDHWSKSEWCIWLITHNHLHLFLFIGQYSESKTDSKNLVSTSICHNYYVCFNFCWL